MIDAHSAELGSGPKKYNMQYYYCNITIISVIKIELIEQDSEMLIFAVPATAPPLDCPTGIFFVREAHVSRHNGGTIEDAPSNPLPLLVSMFTVIRFQDFRIGFP